MRNIMIILVLIFFPDCQKSPSNTFQVEKKFNTGELSKLSLDSIDNFWKNESLVTYSNYFINYSGYLGGVSLRCGEKRLGVAIFESQEKAILCMEGRINSVAIAIYSNIPNEILRCKWWNAYAFGSSVFANQWNTIIEVSLIPYKYDDVDTLLMTTAADIAKRIDQLSEEL
jgi:hypothetical protein